MKTRVNILVGLLLAVIGVAQADIQQNFPDRKALIVNSCPYVELSDFGYRNFYGDRSSHFAQDLKWKNIGTQPLVAFEVVILKYDPFDRRLIGSRWIISGKNSADWTPLPPGESSGDGTRSYGDEEVFTAIVYVRSARLQDGTIWMVNDTTLAAELKKSAPSLRQFGSLEPDPEPAKSNQP